MAQDHFANLSRWVQRSFGEPVTISRVSGGTYNPATSSYAGAVTIGPVTVTADEQAMNRFVRDSGPAAKSDLDEVVYNFDAADIAATAIVHLREGDVVTKRGVSRRVVSVTYQADQNIVRAVCRTESRVKAS